MENYREKPWGYEQVLKEEKGVVVKNLVISKGARISYQYHNKRTENWQIVSGEGYVIINDKKFKAFQGTEWEIKAKDKHRVEAITDLVIREVSIDVVEDDIVRIEDDYHRETRL